MIDLYPRCVNVLDTSVEPVFLPFEKMVSGDMWQHDIVTFFCGKCEKSDV